MPYNLEDTFIMFRGIKDDDRKEVYEMLFDYSSGDLLQVCNKTEPVFGMGSPNGFGVFTVPELLWQRHFKSREQSTFAMPKSKEGFYITLKDGGRTRSINADNDVSSRGSDDRPHRLSYKAADIVHVVKCTDPELIEYKGKSLILLLDNRGVTYLRTAKKDIILVDIPTP